MLIKFLNRFRFIKRKLDAVYWERNALALKYAEGWYFDFIFMDTEMPKIARYKGWDRVLSLENGSITFHIPNDFDVGNLPQIERNWDGHTTEEKWKRILKERGI